MNLVCSKLLCAVAAPHEYETVTAVFSCAGNEFTAKGKTVLVPGWKEIDQRFRSNLKADTEEEVLNTLPEPAEGQSFSVMANVSGTLHVPAESLHRRYAPVGNGAGRGRRYAGGSGT